MGNGGDRMKEQWIQKAIKRPGAFTAKAKRANMSVREYINAVLSKKSNASTRTKRQALLAKTLKKIKGGK